MPTKKHEQICNSAGYFVIHRHLCFRVFVGVGVAYYPTIDINSSEKSVNESLEGFGEIAVALSYTVVLDSGLKLLSGHLSIL